MIHLHFKKNLLKLLSNGLLLKNLIIDRIHCNDLQNLCFNPTKTQIFFKMILKKCILVKKMVVDGFVFFRIIQETINNFAGLKHKFYEILQYVGPTINNKNFLK